MSRTPFYETDSESRWWFGLTGRAVAVIVVFLVLIGGVSAIVWAVNTGTAPIRGKAGAYRQQQSTDNRISQQATFEQLNADYNADLTKIKIGLATVANAKKANDVQLYGMAQTDLIGVESHCVGLANDYNAKSRMYLAKDFKSADLPFTLDGQACAQ